MPRYRIFGNIVLSFLTKLASGYWHLFDPQNGYTAITQDMLRRLPINRIASRYSFENDLLINLNILRVPAIDVPIPAVYGDEVSTIRLRRVVPEMTGCSCSASGGGSSTSTCSGRSPRSPCSCSSAWA